MAATKCPCGTVRKKWMRTFYYCFRCKTYYDFVEGRWVKRVGGNSPRLDAIFAKQQRALNA